MAGAGAKLFNSGDVLTAAQVNTYLMDQTIMKFDSVSARDAAFGGAGEPTLAEGMFAYTTDTNTLWLYTGSTDGWVNVLGSSIGQQALSNRNVIINGAMQVAQRGTSSTGLTGAGYFTADRWNMFASSLGTWTQSVENDAPTGSGFRKSLKMLCTTADASPAAGDVLLFTQNLEGQNVQQFLKGTSSAKQFSLTFWVKGSTTGTYIVELNDADNSRSVSAAYSIAVAGTWEKKTVTFPADTTGAFDNDNASSLELIFWLGAGSDYTSGTLATTWGTRTNANRAVGGTNLAGAINRYWQVTGVQLEAGAVATPFEFEDYGVTLAKCQRYYYRNTPGSIYGNYAVLASGSSTLFEGSVHVPVTMRTGATSVEYSSLVILDPGVDNHAVTSLTIAQTGQTSIGISINIASSAIAQGDAVVLRNNNTTSGYLAFSAEL